MSKTPTKTTEPLPNNFSPKEINSPNKETTGVSKTVYVHISNLHRQLTDWIRVRDKGTKLCRAISSLKLHECDDDYYPQQLGPLTESLMEALESLKNVVDGVKTLDQQLQALAKLQPGPQPVILTWPMNEISKTVSSILDGLNKEYRLKQIVTENIAHCRDEHLIEMYVSAWEFEAYFHEDSYAYLFVEVGLTAVT